MGRIPRMFQDQPHHRCQNVDERAIVEAMIRDQHPEYWEKCHQFVSRCVYARANNILSQRWDDMVQDIMIKIMKYLPHFRFQCTLRTWLNAIIEHHIIDEYRKQRNVGPHPLFSAIPAGETDSENTGFGTSRFIAIEDAFEELEKIRVGIEALLEYTNNTSNPVRNRHIIRLVLFEGKTYADAAKAAGCNAPVVGYVVREAQRYAREKWNS